MPNLYEELRAALHTAYQDKKQLVIDAKQELWRSIQPFLQAYLPNGILRLDLHELKEGVNQSFTVIGKGQSVPFKDLIVQLDLSVFHEKILLSLSNLAPLADWTFDKQFPNALKDDTVWGKFIFNKVQLTLTNKIQVESRIAAFQAQGLFFQGDLKEGSTLYDILRGLKIGDDQTKLTFTGGIEYLQDTLGSLEQPTNAIVPTISLQANVFGKTGQLVDFLRFENFFVQLNLAPRFNKATFTWLSDTTIDLGFDLIFETKNNGTSYIPISTTLKSLDKPFTLSIGFQEGIQALLSDLIFANQIKPALNSLPNSSSLVTEVIKVKNFQIGLDIKGASAVSFVGFGIAFAGDKPWVLVDKVLSVELVEVDLRVDDLLFYPALTLMVRGYTLIGDKGILMLGGSYTGNIGSGFEFVAQLLQDSNVVGHSTAQTGPLDILEVIRHFDNDNPDAPTEADLPKLLVKKLSLYGTTKSPASISAAAELAGPWVFELGEDFKLGLDSLSGEIEKTFGEKGETTFKVKAVTIIGTEQFAVSVAYEGAKKGWTVSGALSDKTPLSIGTWLGELSKTWGITDADIPPGLKDWKIDDLELIFKTKPSTDIVFKIRTIFKVNQQDCQASLQVELIKKEGKWSFNITGEGNIAGHFYKLFFDKTQKDNLFLAAYTHDPSIKEEISLKGLVAGWDEGVAKYIPDLKLALDDVLVALLTTQEPPATEGVTHFLLGLNIHGDLDFSYLPLVGKLIPKDKPITFNDFHFYVASRPLSAAQMLQIQQAVPAEISFLGTALKEGVTVKGQLDFAGFQEILDSKADLKIDETKALSSRGDTGAGNPNIKVVDNATWISLKKDLGPLHIERVGFQYDDGVIWLFIDAALSISGLKFSLTGLGIGVNPHPFHAHFDISGVSVQFKKAGLELGGAFLKRTLEEKIPADQASLYEGYYHDGKITYNEYAGGLIVKVSKLTLSAIGAYADRPHTPSFFASLFIKAPLGGPPFFFVTGLVAAFGYNRLLKVPTIDKVPKFPLVAQVLDDDQKDAPSLADQLKALDEYIPISPHGLFIAAGLRFTSFKVVDGFAMLAFIIGEKTLEIDVIGFASISAPPKTIAGDKTPQVAFIELAILLRFDLAKGFLGLNAQLTDKSYILSKKAKLTGGLALWAWLWGEHSGDFVISLGGYHPLYKVPAHYPQVPRVGLSWKISDALSIKGGIYAAIVPSAFMAGVEFRADYQSGNLKAWFDAHFHTLIAWAPYHYDVDVSIDIGVSYTFWLFGKHTIKVELGASLHIWGPDFSGKATIKYWVISFTVKFGAGAAPSPSPIAWKDFQKFLPEVKDTCTITATGGLINEADNESGKLWIMRASDFALSVETALPAQEVIWDGKSQVTGLSLPSHGIAPMDIAQLDQSDFIVTLTRQGSSENFATHFRPTLIQKNLPSALWGTSVRDAVEGNKHLIENVPSGLALAAQSLKMGDAITGDVDQRIEGKPMPAWVSMLSETQGSMDFDNLEANYPPYMEAQAEAFAALGLDPSWHEGLVQDLTGDLFYIRA